ncbi:AHL_G0017800.mRNA.1.CDS.1 [Saccharomyces cerevisiae]|nr:AHL_G0017800.mRNA.1.CDS.1 [Saccharomyces cerevisiae]CAI6651845.1 AHL_G0017800.mRNA.1.CDS.1 [Saccharomyces cerevisiae]
MTYILEPICGSLHGMTLVDPKQSPQWPAFSRLIEASSEPSAVYREGDTTTNRIFQGKSSSATCSRNVV